MIGCGSGVTAISSTEDVLGRPTALFYARAGAVVSTLWPIQDEDGAAFSTEFYGALKEQQVLNDSGQESLLKRSVGDASSGAPHESLTD